MKRTKGFTLVELLVVIAIIALLAALILPFPGRTVGPSNRAYCASHLKNIGTGIKMYQAANEDSAPWIASDDWSSTTGTNARSGSTPTTVSPTALMFMLVRSGQTVEMFRCPSDKNATKMANVKFTHTDGKDYYYWDFYDESSLAEHCRTVSYSYQAPLYDPSESSYSSGYTAASQAGLAIMADKTPAFDGKTPTTDWSAKLSKKQRKAGMSQNHDAGDFINVLFADSHVKGCKRADVGVGDDNIYSASNSSDAGTQGAGSLTLTQHLSEDDSFLIGPVK